MIKTLVEKITIFENSHFGEYHPYGNKIEARSVLPEGEPFLFFDTDTLITGALDRVPFDFKRPSPSLQVEGPWPVIELNGFVYKATWKTYTIDLSSISKADWIGRNRVNIGGFTCI